MRLLQFFEESNGQLSNTRLNSSLAVYIALAQVIVYMAGGPPVDYAIFTTLLGVGFGVKLIQKPMEGKKNGNVA